MFTLLLAPLALRAQTTPSATDLSTPSVPAHNGNSASASLTNTQKVKKTSTAPKPFSRLALSGGVSAMGVNMQAAVNANRFINLRGIGNYLDYSVNNISTNGFAVNGKLNFATAGAAIDFYPFPNHGFRLSPGALFLNNNGVTANMTANGGTSFTLNNTTYYSSSSNPVRGTGSLTLNKQNPAPTFTTGWGNLISRRGGHWSFPVEIGAAMIDYPLVNIALTGGQACDAHGLNCVNVATDSNVQANLQAQIAKYNKDLRPLRFYPIVSFGVGYNFRIR